MKVVVPPGSAVSTRDTIVVSASGSGELCDLYEGSYDSLDCKAETVRSSSHNLIVYFFVYRIYVCTCTHTCVIYMLHTDI